MQRVRHERRQRARRRGTGAVYPFSRRKARKSHAEERSPADAASSSRNTRGSSRRFARQSEGHAAPDAILGYPRRSSSVSFVFSATDSPVASVFKSTRSRARCFRGAAGLCAFVAAARASLGTRTDVADVAVVDVIFARPVDADADVACEIFADGVASSETARRGKIIPSLRIARFRGIVTSRSREAWNRDSGTIHRAIASRCFDATRDANILPRLGRLENQPRASRRGPTPDGRARRRAEHPRRRAPLHRRPRRRVPEENIVTSNSAFGRRVLRLLERRRVFVVYVRARVEIGVSRSNPSRNRRGSRRPTRGDRSRRRARDRHQREKGVE